MKKKRIAMNVLWCLVSVFALFCWQIIRRDWYEQRREEIADQRAVEFTRYSPAEWAVVGKACRSYWQVAKDMKDEFAAKPPLPALLENLTVRYLDVYPGSDGFTLYWSDGFFGDDAVSLKYGVFDGKETLTLNSIEQTPFARQVWPESTPSQ